MKDYLYKYRNHIMVIGLFVFLIHGAKLNNDIIGIDTEDLIYLGDGFYGGWLQSGRYGLVALKYLLGNAQFNPYFTGAMTLILLAVAVSVFFMLFDRITDTKTSGTVKILSWALGGFLWISHPVLVEQLYFSLQSMEICIGIILTAVALYLSYCMANRFHVGYAVFSVLLLLITFSTYQVFVVLYIFGACVILLLQALRDAGEEDISGKKLLKCVIPYGLVFFVAFFLNTLITKLFFGSSEYLQNQISWGNESFKDCIHAIVGHVLKTFSGYDSIFYNAGLGVLAVFNFILLIGYLRKVCKGKKCAGVVIVLFYMAVMVTPFMMTFVLGNAPAIRSQLVLPAIMGFMGYLCVRLIIYHEKAEFKKIWTKVAVVCCLVVCLVSGVSQAKVSASLYYTDRCRYEHDAALARDLIQRIEKINFDGYSLPVVVIGKREFVGSNACVIGEIVGCSFFDYDTEVEPVSFWSTRRILGFMHNFGANWSQVPVERIEEAMEHSLYMPGWPYENCVQEIDGMIIVKLSHYE